MKTLGLISLCAGFAAGGVLLHAASAGTAADRDSDGTATAPDATKTANAALSATTDEANKTARDHSSASAGATKSDPTGAKSTSYPDKETYPHSGANSSPTALIGGGNPSGGGEPIAPSTSVIANRITEWKLGASDIESEMKNGAIMRTKDIGAGQPTGQMDDEGLHTYINNRLLADSETVRVSTSKMEVKNGEVTFNAASASPELLGRAVAIVLDTQGVNKVTANVKVDPNLPGKPSDDGKRIMEINATPRATPKASDGDKETDKDRDQDKGQDQDKDNNK